MEKSWLRLADSLLHPSSSRMLRSRACRRAGDARDRLPVTTKATCADPRPTIFRRNIDDRHRAPDLRNTFGIATIGMGINEAAAPKGPLR
jgi:hypothetical protein